MSLLGRLALWVTFILGVTTLVSTSFVYRSFQFHYEEESQEAAEATAILLARSVLTDDGSDKKSLEEIKDLVKKAAGTELLLVHIGDSDGVRNCQIETKKVGENWKASANCSNEIRSIILEVLRDTSHERVALSQVLWVNLSVMVVSFLLAILLLVWLLRRQLSEPIEQIVSAAQKLPDGKYEPLNTVGTSELNQLVNSLNTVSEKLKSKDRVIRQSAQQRKALQREIREAEQLASTGRLAASVAHELGTALNVVAGRAQLIEEDSDDSRVQESASIIRKQAHVMTDYISSVKNLARRSSERKEYPLGELFKECELIVDSVFDEEAEVFFGSSGELMVLADRTQFFQVLINLVQNAVDAMDGKRGGKVVIEGKAVSRNGVDKVEVSVSDNGPGIEEKYLPLIFDPFFSTKGEGGNGLGLDICKKIVEEQGGELRVESRPGQGTRFYFDLPKKAQRGDTFG